VTGAATRLVLWRHGQTDWNDARRVQGHTDTPINAHGRRQAAAAAALLAALRPAAIAASDLSRAAQTAAVLGELTGLPVRLDARLRERFFGDFQGLHADEIAARFPAEYARWRAGDPAPGRGVESLDDLAKRAAEAVRELAEAHPGQTVVATCHGGTVRQCCAALLGWPPDGHRSLRGLANCHWAELQYDRERGWQLAAYNVGPDNPRRPDAEPGGAG